MRSSQDASTQAPTVIGAVITEGVVLEKARRQIAGLRGGKEFHRIGAQELWADEAYSYMLATAPDWFGPSTLANNTPPFYHFLLRAWMIVAGDSEAALRLLSAIFGVLTVAVLIWIGREMFTPAVGLWSGGFAAIAPIHIFYSQEARGYSLMIFALALSYVLLWRALAKNTLASWIVASLAAAFALYSHNSAFLGLLPTALLPWCSSRDRPTAQQWRHYLVAMTAAFALFCPWVATSLLASAHPLDDPALPWLRINWLQTPPSLAIPKSLAILGIGGHAGLVLALVKQFRFIEFPRWLEVMGIVTFFALLLLSAVPWGDDRLGIPAYWKRKIWLWTTLLFPLGTMWLVSYFLTPMYIVGRYDLVVFVAYALLVGIAMEKLRRAGGRGWLVAICAVCILSIPLSAKLYLYYRVAERPDSRQTAEYLDLAVANDDVLVFTGVRGQSLLYSLRRLGYRWNAGMCRSDDGTRHFACRFIPRDNERTQLVYARPAGSSLLQELETVTAGLPASTGTLWLVFQRVGNTTDGRELLDPDASFIEDVRRLGFSVVLERSRAGIYAFHRAGDLR